jgi:hypothetical protein
VLYAALLGAALLGVALAWRIRSPDADPEARRAAALERRLARVAGRNQARRQIALDLIARRLTLLRAAGRFRDFDEGNPDFNRKRFRDLYEGATDVERYCRRVIEAVGHEVVAKPDAPQDLVRRLEAELQGRLRSGTLHWPCVTCLPCPLASP